MNAFDINEIEEVETKDEEGKSKVTNHKHNQNNNHNHNYRKKKGRNTFIIRLGFFQSIVLLLFFLSIFVLFFSFFINYILTIKKIIIPKIFMPGIILFFMTFLFSGGILGTYVPPSPWEKNNLKNIDIIAMRIISPIVMLIISIIFLIFGLDNIKYLKKDIKGSQNICESNKGLTMEEIYIKSNQTNYELERTRYNIIYLYNNNLVCYPKGKCIKLKNEENNYICNTDDFIKNENIYDAKCDKVNFDLKNIYTIDKDKDANIFIENCNEINEKDLLITNIFKCESKKDLTKIKSSNLDVNDKSKIDNYYNNKIDNYKNEIQKNKEMMDTYDNSNFTYHLECYNSLDYISTFFLINVYCIIYYFCSFSWIYLGFEEIIKLFKYLRKNNNNKNERKNINFLEKEEDNSLINEKYSKIPNKYIELSDK